MDERRAAALAGVMYYLQQEAEEREAESVRMSTCRRSDWSAYGRNAVARGRHTVQGRRIRRFVTGAPAGRRYRPGVIRPCQRERGIDPSSVPHTSGMQTQGNRSGG